MTPEDIREKWEEWKREHNLGDVEEPNIPIRWANQAGGTGVIDNLTFDDLVVGNKYHYTGGNAPPSNLFPIRRDENITIGDININGRGRNFEIMIKFIKSDDVQRPDYGLMDLTYSLPPTGTRDMLAREIIPGWDIGFNPTFPPYIHTFRRV